MGILDDAIREHLDLKRRQGADQEELARLEDEAFGPPSRPGDPDFAERGPDGEQAPNGTPEATVTEIPPFGDEETDASEAAAGETAIDLGPDSDLEQSETTLLPGAPTVEHDTLGEGEEPESIELDIDLDIDEELEDSVAESPEAESGGGEAGTATDEPVESLDTVEHHFEDAIDEAEVVEEGSEDAGADSDDDVLEETPEFLRDAPEDDELWFEQGEPKDFDF
jgi:hypothetical protein